MHTEMKKSVKEPLPGGRKKPCRYFNNGNGQCRPRYGNCSFDHSVIPFSERELCFQKQECRYKPFCIFFHPEGQTEEVWEQNKGKEAKICIFAEKGVKCLRSFCRFFHPTIRKISDFHWDQPSKPPLMEREEMLTESFPTLPQRVPVIVKNRGVLRQEIPNLIQGLKKMTLN